MSSWSGSRPPPQRDPYPPDSYRREWDAYGRDKAWADYERDRAAYDYGRRGRSRSPTYDDVGRKRRRSTSPYDRERYDPRPRYDDYDPYRDGYGYSPPRSRGPYGHGPSYGDRSRGPVDPNNLDFPATLKQYAEWFRYYYSEQAAEEDKADKAAEEAAGDGSKPRNGIKAKWEKYKKDFLTKQLRTLFDHHRRSPWFAEKYDPSPEFAALRARARKVGWRGRMAQFINDLETGKYDDDVGADEDDSNQPERGSPKDGLAPEESESPTKPDEDFGMGLENDEDDVKNEANGKASYDSRSAEKDEVSVLPEGNQVMIRTIPPDIGRVKLEAALKGYNGFVYLALGDPMQKRNYYRAGWIRFDEHADMQNILSTLGEKKIEGFKLHLSHNTRPFSGKVRFTPEVASRPDRIEKDLAQVRRLAAVLEDEYERVRTFRPEPLVVQPEGTEGSEQPEPEDVLTRDALAEDEPPLEKGSDAVERRIERLVTELPPPENEEEEKALEVKKNTIALDLYLAYLRAAFHTCYYCVCVCDHIEELQRKCIKHVRKPLPETSTAKREQRTITGDRPNDVEQNSTVGGEAENADKDDKSKGSTKQREQKGGEFKDSKRSDERWLEWLDNKVALLVNRDGIDVRDYGGKQYEDELEKFSLINQEEEGKFRCNTCSKLFKASPFVQKHIVNKHPELVKQLDDLTYFNNFALDPQRIQPFSHYPQQLAGQNMNAPPPQAYGLQNVLAPHMMGGAGPPGHYGMPGAYPPYANGGDPYGGYQYGYVYPPPMTQPPTRHLRDEPPLAAGNGGGRRLGDRIGGFAPEVARPGHGIEGLPAKPPATLEPGPGGRRNGGAPPPPPNAKEDPRASSGRKVSYHDMDLVAEGDVELNY